MNRHGRRRREPAWRRLSLRCYHALLWLYPPPLRRAHGDEMLQLFRDMLREEVARQGPPGAVRAWKRTLTDLAVSVPREWPRELRRVRLRRGVSTQQFHSRSQLVGQAAYGRMRGVRRERMQEKFEKFTERARKVLSLSQEEAQRFNHNYIGTEHLLLGLVREGDGVAAKVLLNLGVELERVRSAVEFIIGRGDRIVLGEIGLTPRAKKVIELAVDEARRLNHHYVGTEHLLLGLVREGEGIAAGVLESLGVNLEKVRAATLQVLNQSGPGFTQSASASRFSRGTLEESTTRADFGKFTERARLALRKAIIEAHQREQAEVGTGHMLLALLQDTDSLAAQTLRQIGIDLDQTRRELIQSLGEAPATGEQPTSTPVSLDRHALRMFALAADEALRMGDHYVGAEHLLLGLLREGDGLGGQTLISQATDLDILRAATTAVRAQAANRRDKRPVVGQLTLRCHDVLATMSFYTHFFEGEPVGPPRSESDPMLLRLPGGGLTLALLAATDDHPVSSGLEIDIWVGDVEGAWSDLRTANVASLSDISDGPDSKTFTVNDPDGRMIHVREHQPQPRG